MPEAAPVCSDTLVESDSGTRVVRDFSLQWAAGFVDGEGCIHISKQQLPRRRNASYRLGVSVTQNDLDVLEHLRDGAGVGARIYKVKRSPQHRRQCYTLNYSGPNAMKLIDMLEPHLVRKRREAQAARDFCTLGRVSERPGGATDPAVVAIREHYFNELKRLK